MLQCGHCLLSLDLLQGLLVLRLCLLTNLFESLIVRVHLWLQIGLCLATADPIRRRVLITVRLPLPLDFHVISSLLCDLISVERAWSVRAVLLMLLVVEGEVCGQRLRLFTLLIDIHC